MPSGEDAAVLAREEVISLRLGPGFCAGRIHPVREVLRVRSIPSPLPLHCMYVGNGFLEGRLHPSPWCNPLAGQAADGQDARHLFTLYAMDRADARSWLYPLSGMVLVSEDDVRGAHAEVLRDLVDMLSEEEEKHLRGQPDRAQTDLDPDDDLDDPVYFDPILLQHWRCAA